MHKEFESTLEPNQNWGRLSDMVAVMFSDIVSHENTFEKIFSMRVLERLVSFVGYKNYGIIEFEARESRNWLMGWCSLYFTKLMVKSLRRNICFCCFKILSSCWLIRELKSNASILGWLWKQPTTMLFFLELINSVKVDYRCFFIHIKVNT